MEFVKIASDIIFVCWILLLVLAGGKKAIVKLIATVGDLICSVITEVGNSMCKVKKAIKEVVEKFKNS